MPFIRNVTLIPRYQWNGTTMNQYTLQQCLCLSMPSFIAFNWYPNNTCQLFSTFPRRYKIEPTPDARLYFPQGIFPNASQCCMPDLNVLLQKLYTGTRTSVNILLPRNLLIDRQGYLVTVGEAISKLVRFHPRTLNLINRTSLPGAFATAVGYANNAYFVVLPLISIAIIDSENLTVLGQVSAQDVQDLGSVAFLDDGSTMVITSGFSSKIVFYRRPNRHSLNYTLIHQQSVGYLMPYGLNVYNDTLFYVTSYSYNTVYAYNAIENSTSWTETLFIDGRSVQTLPGGSYVTIDECGRYWFALQTSNVYIYDLDGSLIGNFSLAGSRIVHMLITDDYVVYFSDQGFPANRIIRIDPNIEC